MQCYRRWCYENEKAGAAIGVVYRLGQRLIIQYYSSAMTRTARKESVLLPSGKAGIDRDNAATQRRVRCTTRTTPSGRSANSTAPCATSPQERAPMQMFVRYIQTVGCNAEKYFQEWPNGQGIVSVARMTLTQIRYEFSPQIISPLLLDTRFNTS